MRIDGWRYYNHSAIPTIAPHETPNLVPIENDSIWKIEGTPLLARWTTDFDCNQKTNWWYVIKDTPFDIATVKAKRRYEINKGNKNFIVTEIDPSKYADAIYQVAISAYENYPPSYRPNVEYESFVTDVRKWNFYKVYGAFAADDHSLCGYACLNKKENYIAFLVMKANPSKEKLGVNAALVYKILTDHASFLSCGGYICDGSRSILHETAFQDYLEKYFEFRKAYCKLHIVYNPKYKVIIYVAYAFRGILKKFSFISPIRKANALLRMEEIHRSKK